MKKLILVKFILAALLVFPLFELTATTSPDRELTPEEVAIRNITNPVDPERERSLIPTVEAWLYRNTGEVEVIFNRDCGTANVTIINSMGQSVCNKTYQSLDQPVLFIKLPSSGEYIIYITTSEGFQGSGNLSL